MHRRIAGWGSSAFFHRKQNQGLGSHDFKFPSIFHKQVLDPSVNGSKAGMGNNQEISQCLQNLFCKIAADVQFPRLPDSGSGNHRLKAGQWNNDVLLPHWVEHFPVMRQLFFFPVLHLQAGQFFLPYQLLSYSFLNRGYR